LATNRRRTEKKNIGQTLNDVENRIKKVERRSTPVLGVAQVGTDNIGSSSVTYDKLSEDVRALLDTLINSVDSVSTNLSDINVLASNLSDSTSYAQATADGKNIIYYQNIAPADSPDLKIDDLWFDTDDAYKPYRWDGTAWTAVPFGSNAISDLNVGKLTTGTLSASMAIQVGTLANNSSRIVIDGGLSAAGIRLISRNGSGVDTITVNLDASTGSASFLGDITSGSTITGSTFKTSTNVGNGSTAGVKIDSTGANFYNAASSTPVTSINSTTGVLSATGATISGTLTATAGTIGGFTLSGSSLSAGSAGTFVTMSTGATAFSAGGATPASAPFNVSQGGALTASSATITGTINATDGFFGVDGTNGWNINSNLLQSKSVSSKSITLDAANAKIYIANGTGTYGNAATAFYVDSTGLFSITDKLLFDPGLTDSGGFATLTVIGRIRGAIDNVAIVPPDSSTYTVTGTVISGTTPNQTAVLTTSATHTFLVGDTVIVAGLTGSAALANGAWEITAKTTNTLTFTGVSGATNGTYTGLSGTARVRELTLGLHPALNGSPAGIGIRLDEYNYWFLNNKFRVGTAGSYVLWDGTTLSVSGTINANAGNFTSTVTVGSGATAGTLTVGTNATATNRITITGTDTAATTKIYSGTGTFTNANTPFYMDASGQFSLGANFAVSTAGNLSLAGTITSAATITGGVVQTGAPSTTTASVQMNASASDYIFKASPKLGSSTLAVALNNTDTQFTIGVSLANYSSFSGNVPPYIARVNNNEYVMVTAGPWFGLFNMLRGAGPTMVYASAFSRSGSTVTVTTSAAHGLAASDSVTISAFYDFYTEWSGNFTVLATGLTTTQFQVTNAASTSTSIEFGGVISKRSVAPQTAASGSTFVQITESYIPPFSISASNGSATLSPTIRGGSLEGTLFTGVFGSIITGLKFSPNDTSIGISTGTIEAVKLDSSSLPQTTFILSASDGALRLYGTTPTVSLASTGHPLQIGLSSGYNLAFGTDSGGSKTVIQSRNAGAAAALQLNALGGNVQVGDSSSTVTISGLVTAPNMNVYTYVTETDITLAANQTTYAGTPDASTAGGRSFVAPASGCVVVTILFLCASGTANSAAMSFQVRTGGTVGSGTIVVPNSSPSTADYNANAVWAYGNPGGNQYLSSSWTTRVTGLTANTTYNIKLVHYNSDTVTRVVARRRIIIQPEF